MRWALWAWQLKAGDARTLASPTAMGWPGSQGTQGSLLPIQGHLITETTSGLKIYTVAELCPKARGKGPNFPFVQAPPGWPYSYAQSFLSVLGSLAKYTADTLKLA